MNNWGIVFLFALTAYTALADDVLDKTKQATRPVYSAQPGYSAHQYYPHSNRYAAHAAVPNYGYDTYPRYDGYNYGAQPLSYDTGDQRLHLSGGIYRPYGYENAVNYNTGHKPYAYDNAYYSLAASRYGRNPYSHQTYY